MTGNIFQEVKDSLQPRLAAVVQNLLPGGRISGREYLCASLQGGQGDSCRTNLETGVGSDFATGDSWRDVIDLAAKIWNMRQGEAARELGKQYGIGIMQTSRPAATSGATQPAPASATFTPILPVPQSAPEPPRHHSQHGQASAFWRYRDAQGRALAYTVRFDSPDGKVILPLCFGHYGAGRPQWHWKALPEPRPLYGLPKFTALPETTPVLLAEGEKATDAAQAWFPHYAVLTWSGGANAVSKADFSPLQGREVIIWPDNDEPGFAAALELAKILESTARSLAIVQPPDTLPDGWDVADPTPPGFLPQVHIDTAMPVAEFASGLACTKREGNTLSMGIRCFWDSGDYAPLTKNNPVTVKGAHINIITHITMQELAVALADVQAFNGFGNRFLWICARRFKLVALPSRMPETELAPLQRELWRLVGHAQKRGTMTMNAHAEAIWESIYPEISREHTGLAGSIINRAEAQTLRLALVYALLDGQERIAEPHLRAALAMWSYAQDSALYIFGDRAADPLEGKILEALKQGPLTATELSRVFSGHVSKERLQPVLQQLADQRRISITKRKNGGRPKVILALHGVSEESAISEKSEFSENREGVC